MTQENPFRRSVFTRQLEVVSKKVRIAETEEKYFHKVVRSPEDVYKTYNCIFSEAPVELFVVLHLSSSNSVTAFEIITKGILNSSLVHPREVFRSAIIQNAANVILAHNHPSGNPEPSAEDIQITKQIVEAGKIIGIPITDHIIFADGKYCSFAERGLI